MKQTFKGFNKDLQCRGFQFEVGKTYEHDGAVKACDSGFHACENPFDVWDYYSPCDARYAVVTQDGELSEHEVDSKVASAKITIDAELSLPEFVSKAVSWLFEHCATTDSDKPQAASGRYSKLAASGYNSNLAASGYNSNLAASGDNSTLAASGRYSNLAASGDNSKLAASGYKSKLAASGNDSAIASSGIYSRAKGVAGTWISLAEFVTGGKCCGFATGCIGQDGLLPDVYYKARDGKLVRSD